MNGFQLFHSDPAKAVEHPAGRHRFAPGKRCTRLPLLDPETGLDFRGDMDDAEAIAKRLGGRLPTDEEWKLIAKEHAHFIKPVIIRETPEEYADRMRRGGTDPLERMGTIEWAQREDTGCLAELAASEPPYDGDLVLLNFGKAKVARTDAERVLEENVNDGWQLAEHSTAFIQPRSTVHRGHLAQIDYSEKIWLVFDEDLPSDPPYKPDASWFSQALGIVSSVSGRVWALFKQGEQEAFAAAPPATPQMIVPIRGDIPDIAPLFVPAKYFRVGRRGDVLWIILHTAECTEAPNGARAVAEYFHTIDREASADFCVDHAEAVQCVRLADTSFACGTTGNDRGKSVELVGWARQTPAEWADAYSVSELELGAKLVAALCAHYNLPMEYVDVDGLKAMRPGITTHAAISAAFHESTHTDPGPNFPMDHFLDLVRAQAMSSI